LKKLKQNQFDCNTTNLSNQKIIKRSLRNSILWFGFLDAFQPSFVKKRTIKVFDPKFFFFFQKRGKEGLIRSDSLIQR